jgi:hypothetical protein
MTHHRPTAAAVAVALAAALPSAGAAVEYTRFESLWFEQASPRSAPAPTALAQVSALLNLPPGWMAGDAAVLMVGDRSDPKDARDRLVAALIGEGAAVLELDAHPAAQGWSPPDSAVASAPPAPRDLLPGLFGALLALRRDAGAGLVVAVGYAAGGQAALLATAETEADRHLGPGGPRFAAAASLGPGRSAFAAGAAAPPAEEGWPARAAALRRARWGRRARCTGRAGAGLRGRARIRRRSICAGGARPRPAPRALIAPRQRAAPSAPASWPTDAS